jgi:hypothetical protein
MSDDERPFRHAHPGCNASLHAWRVFAQGAKPAKLTLQSTGHWGDAR